MKKLIYVLILFSLITFSLSTFADSPYISETPSAQQFFPITDERYIKSKEGTQGDVLYFNNGIWTELPIGTAGQVLEVNVGATAPEWDTDDTGGAGSGEEKQFWTDTGGERLSPTTYNTVSINTVLGRFYGALGTEDEVTANTVSANTIDVGGSYTFPLGSAPDNFIIKSDNGVLAWEADATGAAASDTQFVGWSQDDDDPKFTLTPVTGNTVSANTIIGTDITATTVTGTTAIYIDSTLYDKNFNTQLGFWNGSFLEAFNALVTSNGTTVTLTLDNALLQAPTLTMNFSDGYSTIVSGSTITLTAGDDDSPTANYIYIPQSTKVLTKSTSAWPSGEHNKIGYFLIPSAGFTQTNGPYVNQNWNDFADGTDNQGHMLHMTERERRSQAQYFSGIDGDGTDDYLSPSAGNVELKSTAGVIYQLHEHDFDAFDTSGDDIVLVKNWFGDAFHDISNLYDIVDDSTGATITNNRYFNLVIWGVGNKSGQYHPMMINLPSGFYKKQADAENDKDGFDDFSMPREFNLESSTGFLIARITIKMKTGGGTWEVASTTDLRGQTPSVAAGGAGGSFGRDTQFVGWSQDSDDPAFTLTPVSGNTVSMTTVTATTVTGTTVWATELWTGIEDDRGRVVQWKDIQFTVEQPDQLDTSQYLTVWENVSGLTLNITEVRGRSDTHYNFVIGMLDEDGFAQGIVADYGTVKNSGGAVPYSVTANTVSWSTITDSTVLYFDASTDDVPNHIKVTLKGYYR